MISTKNFVGDGTTNVFPIDFEIKGEDYVQIWIDDVGVNDRTTYDIINNSIVFNKDNIPASASVLEIAVASTPQEIADLNAPPSGVMTVSQNIDNVNAVAEQVVPHMDEVLLADDNAVIATTKASEASTSASNALASANNAQTSEDNAKVSEDNAKTSETNAKTSEDNAKVSEDNASASATTASTKASEASTSASNAQLEAWIAEANKKTADSYATEPEDTFVKVYTSNGDGTFTATDTTEYSAYHWQQKVINTDVTSDNVRTLTNKTINDVSNHVGANHVHYKVKATEDLVKGDVVKITGYNLGEDATEVAKVTSATDTAFGVAECSIPNGTFGKIVQNGTVDDLDTSAYTEGTILYSNGAGGFTDVKPTTGSYQALAIVLKSNANVGAIYFVANEPTATTAQLASDIETEGLFSKFTVGQSWTNVLDDRTDGVTYTNDTGKPIMVSVLLIAAGNNGGDPTGGYILINEDTYLQLQLRNDNGDYVVGNLTFIALPNDTYELTLSTNGSISRWFELR